jgi:hypothetical protein
MKTTQRDGKLKTVEREKNVTIEFSEALDIAIREFETGRPQKRLRKRFGKQVDFCLSELESGWEHNLDQLSGGYGNPRYVTRSKAKWLDNFVNNPLSGVDNLESEYNSKFSAEETTEMRRDDVDAYWAKRLGQ